VELSKLKLPEPLQSLVEAMPEPPTPWGAVFYSCVVIVGRLWEQWLWVFINYTGRSGERLGWAIGDTLRRWWSWRLTYQQQREFNRSAVGKFLPLILAGTAVVAKMLVGPRKGPGGGVA